MSEDKSNPENWKFGDCIRVVGGDFDGKVFLITGNYSRMNSRIPFSCPSGSGYIYPNEPPYCFEYISSIEMPK